jgi:hypothetical protein
MGFLAGWGCKSSPGVRTEWQEEGGWVQQWLQGKGCAYWSLPKMGLPFGVLFQSTGVNRAWFGIYLLLYSMALGERLYLSVSVSHLYNRAELKWNKENAACLWRASVHHCWLRAHLSASFLNSTCFRHACQAYNSPISSPSSGNLLWKPQFSNLWNRDDSPFASKTGSKG